MLRKKTLRLLDFSEINMDEFENLAKESFLDAHGKSAPKEDLEEYLQNKYTKNALSADLKEEGNAYFFAGDHEGLKGYLKLGFDKAFPPKINTNFSKLDRIYIHKTAYGTGLSEFLLQESIRIARQQNQKGIWLATWVENKRAIRFYEKHGFRVVDAYDFPISKTHYNPNHIMLLEFTENKKSPH